MTVLGGGTAGGRSGQEGRAFVNGTSALVKEIPEIPLSVVFPPREDTARNLLSVARKWLPTGQRVCWCLDLTSSLQACEKKYVLFELPRLRCLAIAALVN